MPLYTAFALGLALVATGAPTRMTDLEAAWHTFDRQVDGLRSALRQENGALIENRGTGPGIFCAEAAFISIQSGNFQFIKRLLTSIDHTTGYFSPAEIADLSRGSEKYDGYRYRCQCSDGNTLRVTIRRGSRVTTLWAYGLDDSAKGNAAAVMREWESLEGRLAASR